MFLTNSNSLPSILVTPSALNNLSLPLFKFLFSDNTLFLPLTLYFLLSINNPFSLVTPTIYTLRLVGCLWLRSGLTRMGGVRFNHSYQGICFIGNSDNGIGIDSNLQKIARQPYPQGNTKLPRSWAVMSKCIIDQVIHDRYRLVYHAFKTKWA